MSSLAQGVPAGLRAAPIPRSERGPAPRRVVVAYGFWLFLLSDIILFSAMFAAYAVLAGSAAGGPTGARLFHRPHVFVETVCLLLSSFTCGCMTLAVGMGSRKWMTAFGAATALLGMAFLGLELSEFADLVARGAGPSRSAFLSAFFALVGLHGSHVAFGLAWLAVMMAQAWSLGLLSVVVGRLLCFALFWHALDIVWIGVFTIVYLGAR
jgi:cytochrome o ubiquinol oxidase subunit 3